MGISSALFLLAVAVATSAAQKPCCYPDQFEIEEGTTAGLMRDGRGSALNEDAKMAFDNTNKRVAKLVTRYEEDGSTRSFRIIFDYKTNSVYQIEPKERRCQKEQLPGEIANCVYANATFLQSLYLGDKKLTVDSFAYFYKADRVAGHVSETVTQGDCLPSSASFAGEEDGTTMLSLKGYYNYVKGIKNPAQYFLLPSYCPQFFSNEPPMYKDPVPSKSFP